jgi:hypothetical protein
MSWDLKPCGTAAAAQRHQYRHEPLCGPCAEAERRRDADRKGCQASTRVPEFREIRNGLPFVPYVYRGTGQDVLTGDLDDGDLAELDAMAMAGAS